MQHSLDGGSKDNITVMVIDFSDGIDYGSTDVYIPQSLNEKNIKNSRYLESWYADAKRNGFNAKEAIQQVEPSYRSHLCQSNYLPDLDQSGTKQSRKDYQSALTINTLPH